MSTDQVTALTSALVALLVAAMGALTAYLQRQTSAKVDRLHSRMEEIDREGKNGNAP